MYFGDWSSKEDVIKDFSRDADVRDDDVILLADYVYEYYEGSAFVLFVRDGKLYEVHGSHCSCYGLEGQWEPEETSWAALVKGDRMSWGHSPEARDHLKALIAAATV